ncbi:MAG: helix-turn-helix domain-containing protein [Fusobacterium sp.]|uniref:helix-turn-helix domain-containing protein n=1 Tax=Fusobacterium sp. TaxID=68766 RepID=UPI0026DAF14F|nr:helix-turn-helix domain-containing protein [Fusobacterium sp.]MDO4690961.1 helix-turn-helix domain-containing protein [Fusobacterium sp.]
MCMREIVFQILKNRMGEYASAKKLSEILGLSLVLIYNLVSNEKVKTRTKYGRREYEISSFLDCLDLSDNIYLIENPLSQEDFYINNFFNWSPKNEIENFLEHLILDVLGEFCSTKELVELFGISKTTWYDLLEQRKLMSFNVESRIVIISRSLLPFLREAMQEK